MEVKVGILNVGTVTGKGKALAEMMVKRKVDILCVQETKWKGKNVGDGCKIFYHGEDWRRKWSYIEGRDGHEAGCRSNDNGDQCVCSTTWVLDGGERQVLDRWGRFQWTCCRREQRGQEY